MAKIIIIRHAESIANTLGIYQGQTYDTGLSDLGKKQAQALAKRLAKEKINRILASPLKRSLETAYEVASVVGVSVKIERKLIETNHGKWEGKDKRWIQANYPNILTTWKERPLEAFFPGGEKFIQTVDRVGKFLARSHWQGNTLVMTHDNIVRIIVCLAQDLDINKMWEFDLEPSAINTFKIEDINGTKKIKIVKLNETSHLKNLRANLSSHAL